MRYIPKGTKVARLWVDAVAASTKIDKTEVAGMYANMCGFKTWDALMSGISSIPPSASDEESSAETVANRKAFYLSILNGMFGINRSLAKYILNKVPPSSSVKPKRFSIETKGLHDPDGDNVLNFDAMREAFGMDTEEDFSKVMDDFAKNILGDSVPEGFSFDNFTNRMRISKPVEPCVWYNMLATFGWDVDEDSYIEDYTYGEESFFVSNKNGDEIPVFITSLCRAPLDSEDDMANEVMDVVLNYCETELLSDKAILFWGSPAVKKINGKFYSHFGMYFIDNNWHEFLLNEKTTCDDMFAQHKQMKCIDEPVESLADEHHVFMAVLKMIADIDQDEEVDVMTVGMQSGWDSLLLSPKK